MDFGQIMDGLIVATASVSVFVAAFGALYLCLIAAPVRGPSWMFRVIIVAMVAGSSFVAYALVIAPEDTDAHPRSAMSSRQPITP